MLSIRILPRTYFTGGVSSGMLPIRILPRTYFTWHGIGAHALDIRGGPVQLWGQLLPHWDSWFDFLICFIERGVQ